MKVFRCLIAEDEGYVLPNDSVLYGFEFLDPKSQVVSGQSGFRGGVGSQRSALDVRLQPT